MSRFGAQLHALRVQRGLTQKQLASRACTTQAIVSRIERGKHSPTLEMLARLYAAMGLELQLAGTTPPVDLAHLAEERKLPMDERLSRAFAWMSFNAQLQGAARKASRDRAS